MALQQTSISKYLGITLDTKLSWNNRIKTSSEKAQKRTSVLKRLTATKWVPNMF